MRRRDFIECIGLGMTSLAASHQRRQQVFTKIEGGPETDIYKTSDAGKT